MPTDTPDRTDEYVANICLSLTATGEARIRTKGDGRSEADARKLLKAGADKAGVEVTTSKGDGYISAEVK